MSTARRTPTTQRAPKRPDIWVVTRRDGFAVKMAGKRFALVGALTERSAVRIARVISREFATELIVQGEHGQIRFRDSHGNDPCPPRG